MGTVHPFLIMSITAKIERELKNTFLKNGSAFWHKCSAMLLMSYEHKDGVSKGELRVKFQLQIVRKDLCICAIVQGFLGSSPPPFTFLFFLCRAKNYQKYTSVFGRFLTSERK